jgi:PAS domain S-box-containing protein
MRLSQDELLIIAYFRSLSGPHRAHLLGLSHATMYAPLYDRARDAVAKAKTKSARLLSFTRTATPAAEVNVAPRTPNTPTPLIQLRRETDALTPIVITDASGACTYANAALATMLGIRASDMIGYGWSNLIHPDERARVLHDWQYAVSNGIPYRGRLRYVIKDREVVVDASANPMFDATGGITGYVCVLNEFTTTIERKDGTTRRR